MRRLGLAVLGGAAAGFGVLWLRPPEPGAYPVCPWLAITGTPCPFCGGLRSAAALLDGDLAAAAGHNLLVAAGVPAVLLGALALVVFGERAAALVSPAVLRSAAVVTAAWFAFRLVWV